MKSYFRLILFLVIFLPFRSEAGWVITGRFIDREGNTIMKRYFIQNNEIKMERYNLIYSCNLKTENIIIVDPVNLVYVKTNLKDYIQKMREIKTKRLQELLALIPEDQRDENEKINKAQVEREIILPVSESDSLVIKQMADTIKLLRHETTKYNVSQNGRKKEEFFLTREVDISADLDLNTFLQYVYLLEPEDKTVKYQASKAYINKVKNGLVLRRFIFEDGYRSEWQVNQVEEKKIPEYEFGIPELCKELTLDKWLKRLNDTDEKYYDDYE